MKSSQEIRALREQLRGDIPNETSEIKKEILREQIFVLDEVLGMFSGGVPKTQFELFALLQTAQKKKTADVVVPTSREEVKSLAEMKMFKWVMGSA